MNVTPEHTATLIQGMTPVQGVIMIFLGVIAIWGIISIVRWIVKIKIGTLPEDIKRLDDKMSKNYEVMIEMKGKLWSEDKIKDEFASALDHHQNECPAWRFHCSMHNNNDDNNGRKNK